MTVIINSTRHLYADNLHIDMQFTGMANTVTEMNTIKPFTVLYQTRFQTQQKRNLDSFDRTPYIAKKY